MNTDVINNAILYLNGSIENFNQINFLLNSATNQKDKTKYNEKLFEIMFDAKDYIKENSLFKLGYDVDDRLEKVHLDGMTKPRYFEKDVKGLIVSLNEKTK